MKTSNPASYDKIFATTPNVVIPSHRALYINCSQDGTIIFTNLDKTTTTVIFVGGNILLPLQINKWVAGTGIFTVNALL